MNPLDHSLAVLDQALALATASDDEYVLFGSVVMHLHGIDVGRPPGDVDVFVSRRVWGALLGATSAEVRTPRADDPPFLEWTFDDAPPIHMFYDWTSRDGWLDVEACFRWSQPVGVRRREPVEDGYEGLSGEPPITIPWRCASLTTIRAHKAAAASANVGEERHAKDTADLAILDAHREADPPPASGAYLCECGCPPDLVESVHFHAYGCPARAVLDPAAAS